MAEKGNEEQNIFFRDLARDFLLTMPFDAAVFIILAIISGAAILLIYPEPTPHIGLIYSALILIIYILYAKIIKPKLPSRYFKSWNYFEESTNDSADVSISHLIARIKFLKGASKFVLMRMGELNSTVWNNRCYINTLKELIKNNVNIEIIMRDYFDVESKEIMKLAIDGKIKLYSVETDLLNSKAPGHFILNEKGNLWLTEQRAAFSEERKGRYTMGMTKISDERKKIFEELKSDSNTILIDNTNIKNINFLVHDSNGDPVQASEEQKRVLFNYLGVAS